jgi:hypothetical protein
VIPSVAPRALSISVRALKAAVMNISKWLPKQNNDMNKIFTQTRNIERELRILGKKFATNINYKNPDYYVSARCRYLWKGSRSINETKSSSRAIRIYWIRATRCSMRAHTLNTNCFAWGFRQRIRMWNGRASRFSSTRKLYKSGRTSSDAISN